MSGGDDIRNLPMSKEYPAKPGDLEIIHNLFQSPRGTQIIRQGISMGVSSFKIPIIAAILFGVLSLPIISTLISGYTKGNVIFTKLILMVLFAIILWILDKVFCRK